MINVTFTLFTKNNGPLTKIIKPDGQGGILKDSSRCYLDEGTAEKIYLPFAGLPHFLRTLKTNQAIGHGVCQYDKVQVVSQQKFVGQSHTVTRTNEYFKYSTGPGIGMFDHDPKPGIEPLSPQEFKDIIGQVHPPFRDVATVYTPSTSSCIYDGDGAELSGISAGFHLYFPVEDASKLPEFGDILFKRVCVRGHGYAFITKAGTPLLRTIFDQSVFSPERLDFVAGAVCEGGCTQKLPEPVFSEGGML